MNAREDLTDTVLVQDEDQSPCGLVQVFRSAESTLCRRQEERERGRDTACRGESVSSEMDIVRCSLRQPRGH